MKPDRKTQEEISEVLERFRTVVANKDFHGATMLFADDPDILLLGSGPGEIARELSELKGFVEQIFSQQAVLIFDWKTCLVSQVGSMAWVYLDATFYWKGENIDQTPRPYRITGVLEKRDGKWLFVQWHGSQPVS